jgi:hypothetical protein
LHIIFREEIHGVIRERHCALRRGLIAQLTRAQHRHMLTLCAVPIRRRAFHFLASIGRPPM